MRNVPQLVIRRFAPSLIGFAGNEVADDDLVCWVDL